MPFSPTTLRRLHRWIGLACSLTVMLAAGSGLLHVVMTWTQPAPPRPEPAGSFSPSDAITPIASLPADLAPLRSVQLVTIADQPWYQAFPVKGAPRYFSARDGHEEPELATTHALDIARRHLGSAGLEPTAFAYTRRLDSFDDEYIAIFRLLPVHRIDVADGRGTRLYVSTVTGSVARATDDGRQFEANLFSLFHKYSFIPNKAARDITLVGFTALAFLASLAGLALFFATRRKA
jgi:hypothetical protein